MISDWTSRLRSMICYALALYLFQIGFAKRAERETIKLLSGSFSFFENKELAVEVMNHLRGDFKVSMGKLHWTFNRYTGELIPWSFQEWKIQNKKKGGQ